MGAGLLLRRLCGTTHDTKDVSKTTDTQYNTKLCCFRRSLPTVMDSGASPR